LSAARLYLESLSAHDFLLAAMVLCLELDLISKAPSPETAGPNYDKVAEMRQLIEISCNIYKQPANSVAQTKRAVKAMELMLRKVKPSNGLLSSDSSASQPTPTTSNSGSLPPILSNHGLVGPTLQLADMGTFEPFDAMFPLERDMDWVGIFHFFVRTSPLTIMQQAWDKFVQSDFNPDSNMDWNDNIPSLDGFADDIMDPSVSLLDQPMNGSPSLNNAEDVRNPFATSSPLS